jgi:hypothetical protein
MSRSCQAYQAVSENEPAIIEGYADQAHLTHSLRRIMGRTPGQILGQAGL